MFYFINAAKILGKISQLEQLLQINQAAVDENS